MADLKTRVVVELRRMIVNGEFSPGDRVAEIPVAEKLDVSRTPVRVALSVLEQEGLLEASATGGYTVRSFTLAQISDAIDVRGILEGLAARLVAEHGLTRGFSQELAACLREGEAIVGAGRIELDSMERPAVMNVKFHRLIVDGSGNEALLRALALNDAVPFSASTAVVATSADPLESSGACSCPLPAPRHRPRDRERRRRARRGAHRRSIRTSPSALFTGCASSGPNPRRGFPGRISSPYNGCIQTVIL